MVGRLCLGLVLAASVFPEPPIQGPGGAASGGAKRAAGGPDSALSRCTVPGVDGPALCGTLPVFEDRAVGEGRTIPLKVVVLPATGPVRARLGYETLNVWGMSYGSFAAQVYARSYPDRVRTLTLTGPMPLDAPMWLDLARSAQHTLERVLAECASQPACRTAYPDPWRELDVVLDRLATSPATVRVEKPDGSATNVRFADRQFRDLLSAAMYTARGMGDVPHLIHAVFSGDYSPVASILAEEAPPDAAAPRGLFLSLLCTESIPKVDPAAVAAGTAGTFVGDFPIRAQMRVCGEWPRAALPEGFWRPVQGSVPMLALVGALDHTTPPRYAQAIGQGFPNGRVIVLPGRGHNDIDNCVAGLITSFVREGRGDVVDAACGDMPQPLAFRLPPHR